MSRYKPMKVTGGVNPTAQEFVNRFNRMASVTGQMPQSMADGGSVTGSEGFLVHSEPDPRILARITNSTNVGTGSPVAYDWIKQLDQGGLIVDDPQQITGSLAAGYPAFEEQNNPAVPVGAIVEIYPGLGQHFLFAFSGVSIEPKTVNVVTAVCPVNNSSQTPSTAFNELPNDGTIIEIVSATVVLTSPAVCVINADFWFGYTTTAINAILLAIGSLTVDGTEQEGHALWSISPIPTNGSTGGQTVSKSWLVTLNAGSHSLRLTARSESFNLTLLCGFPPGGGDTGGGFDTSLLFHAETTLKYTVVPITIPGGSEGTAVPICPPNCDGCDEGDGSGSVPLIVTPCCPDGASPRMIATIANISGCECLAGQYELDWNGTEWEILNPTTTCDNPADYFRLTCTLVGMDYVWIFSGSCNGDTWSGTADNADCDTGTFTFDSITIAGSSCCDGSIGIIVTPPGGGTISRVNLTQGFITGNAILTFAAVSVPGGNLLIVKASQFGLSIGGVTVTYNGVPMNESISGADEFDAGLGVSGQVQEFYLDVPADTTGTVEIETVNTLPNNLAAILFYVQGLPQNLPDKGERHNGLISQPDTGLTSATVQSDEFVSGTFILGNPPNPYNPQGTANTSGGQDVIVSYAGITFILVDTWAIINAIQQVDAVLGNINTCPGHAELVNTYK